MNILMSVFVGWLMVSVAGCRPGSIDISLVTNGSTDAIITVDEVHGQCNPKDCGLRTCPIHLDRESFSK